MLPIGILMPSVGWSQAGPPDEGTRLAKYAARANEMIRKAGLKPGAFSIAVGRHGMGDSLLAINADTPLIPASITKIVTAAAVLKEIPPGTKVKTSLLGKGQMRGREWNGDLCLRGGGDPGFVSETMWFLVNAFVRTGIVKIDGDVVVDGGLFDDSYFDDSRQKQRVDRAYDAPVSAMSFNWNSINVYVRPGKKVGEPADVFLDPENDYTVLKGEVKTVAAGRKTSINVDRVDGKRGGDLIQVSGSIAIGAQEQVIYKSITQPELWAGHHLKAFLAQRNIKVQGKVRKGECTKEAELLAEAESEPIERMLADMNKFSNNYVAEMLTKLLASRQKQPGSIAEGMRRIEALREELSIPKSEMTLVNPSGLTRKNQLSASALLKVLFYAQKNFSMMPEMMASLPIAGVDGTLRRRMKNTSAERFVRAKTGYLTGVISLAGYVGRGNGQVLPFVMIYNGSGDEWKVRELFDDLVLMVIED